MVCLGLKKLREGMLVVGVEWGRGRGGGGRRGRGGGARGRRSEKNHGSFNRSG